MTRAGKFDRQITIEKKVVTGQGTQYGEDLVEWQPLSYLPGSPAVAERYWAEVQDAMPSRSEALQQGLPVARNQSRVRMRWRDDIDSSMRVTVHGDTDRVYQIVGGPAEISGRKQMLEFVIERYST